MEIKILKKYAIEKGNTDMLSSLNKLNKKIIDEAMEEYDANSTEELAKHIIEEFREILISSKNDIFTQIFFKKLIDDENSTTFSACEQDVECFNIFVYFNGECYSYYIPDELKKIIKKEFRF